ncbi:sulfotransferase family protein [Cyanobium sp. ULC084]
MLPHKSIQYRIQNRCLQEFHEILPHFTYLTQKSVVLQTKVLKPIFLLGTEAGGLTLLSRILRRHSHVVGPRGNSDSWASNDEGECINFARLPPRLRLMGDIFTNHNYRKAADFSTPELGKYRSDVYASNQLIDRYRLQASDLSTVNPNPLILEYKKSLTAFRRDPHINPRHLDKSQSYTIKIPFINQVFQDAKFILVSRNPYAICKSHSGERSLGRARANGASRHLDQARLMTLVSQHWFNTFNTAIADLANLPHLFFRFEDFLADPVSHLLMMLQFCELPVDNEAVRMLPLRDDLVPMPHVGLGKWFPLKPDVNAKHLSLLNTSDIALIESVLGDLAAKLGYTHRAP